MERTAMTLVKKGQVYEASARRGARRVRIMHVRNAKTYAPYAVAREVSRSGNYVRGWMRGVNRALPFRVSLTFSDRGHVRMPNPYRLVEAA